MSITIKTDGYVVMLMKFGRATSKSEDKRYQAYHRNLSIEYLWALSMALGAIVSLMTAQLALLI
jgi:hypothetical protein